MDASQWAWAGVAVIGMVLVGLTVWFAYEAFGTHSGE